ncbi:MAG: M3 family oligoendopeptidase [Thermomicrobiales bacterium]|nr:M3 family oligoendopeptidase [Thermomicrobiales bacterium]
MTTQLPHWDMSVVYPDLQSPEFEAGFQSLVERTDALTALFDTHGVGAQPAATAPDDTVAAVEAVVTALNDLVDFASTLGAYVHAFVTTDTRDAVAQGANSRLEQQYTRLSLLETRFTAWIGALDVDALIAGSTIAADHAFALRQIARSAQHQMSPDEESLAAELSLSGSAAWTKLQGNVSSQVLVPIERDGETVELPMSAVRNLAYDADRDVRRSAYEAELAAWRRVDVPIAGALNAIKWEYATLAKRRGWSPPLAVSLFDSHIDQQTLDAMMTAAREAFPDFRRYLHDKAHLLGLERLAWYDLFAPVGASSRTWNWDAATAFVVERFAGFSPRMGALAERAFSERWIDAEPRVGKRDGAYCMPLRRDESRVFANFQPSFSGMSTLAHELGHAYHNLNLAGRTALQREMPMTLAETASIFCETVIRDAVLAESDRAEQLAIIEASLQGNCQIVVDITSRFLFEQAVFDGRVERELSVAELCDAMTTAQRETYGDGLDDVALHPYMWAAKPHYYSGGRAFYNYPYMFGLLFGLGLYARYRQDPAGFPERYDALLSSTGLADAATLAAQFGIDLHAVDFWRASLDIIRGDIERFAELVG